MNKLRCLTLISLLTISCLMISPSTCYDPQTFELIANLCYHSKYPPFCADILRRHLVSPKTDFLGLTKLTFDLSLGHAKSVEKSIEKLGAAIVRNPTEKQIYLKCQRSYGDIVSLIEGAKVAFDRADYGSMVALLKPCEELVQFCEDTIGQVIRNQDYKMRVLLSMGVYEGQKYLRIK